MLAEAQINAILPNWDKLDWYYSIELAPGVFTKGLGFNNIALTQKMLANIELRGTTAIDVGAMEGAMSLVMAKRGATVLSVDGVDLTDRINLIKMAQSVNFRYFADMPLHRFSERIFEIQSTKANWPYPVTELGPSEVTNYGFDVVLSSGVIYHVMNPVDHLMTYRKLCKLGGLAVIECAAAVTDDVTLVHGVRPEGYLYEGFSTWFVSTGWMDVFLRACFFEPLAFCYLGHDVIKGVDTCRICVVARAVGKRAFDPKRYKRHEEMLKSELYFNQDFAGMQAAALMTGRVAKPVKFKTDGLIPITAEGGIRVADFKRFGPLQYKDDYLRFPLNRVYE